MGNAESVPQQAAPTEDQAPLVQADGQLPSALVVVGPSGVGKGTLINKLMEQSDKFGFSCSHTTRQPRPGEENGVHYHFTTKEEFEKGIADAQFLEYAYVHSNIYGTSIKAVKDVAASGRCCVLDIDVQGARQVRTSGLRAIFVFIAPPSMEDLEQRLRGRGTEKEEQITTRLNNAREEMASLEEQGLYDYVIVNDNLDRCFTEFKSIAAHALGGHIGRHDGEPVSATASLKGWLRDGTMTPPGSSRRVMDHHTWGLNPLALEHWRGKVALITGAGSGVGWRLCLLLASAGLKVVATSGGKDELEQLQQAAVESGVPPGEFLPVVCDLTKEGEVVALPRIVAKRWPGCGVDILINGASVQREPSSLISGNTGAWVEMASINILGAAMATREVLANMSQRKSWGHIINLNITSSEGIVASGGVPESGFYGVTKHAMHAMTEGLRKEARAKGLPLRVSGVTLSAGEESSSTSSTTVTAEDVAHAVMWCLSAPLHVDVNTIVVRPVATQ